MQLLALAVGNCTTSSKYDYVGTILKLKEADSAGVKDGEERHGPNLQEIKAKVAFYCGKSKAGVAGPPTWHMQMR